MFSWQILFRRQNTSLLYYGVGDQTFGYAKEKNELYGLSLHRYLSSTRTERMKIGDMEAKAVVDY